MLGLVAKRVFRSKFPNVRAFQTSSTRASCILDHSPNTKLNKELIDRYLSLPMPECAVQVQYVWIDGTGENLRCKSRTLNFVPSCAEEIPTWSLDGSSSFFAKSGDSDTYIKPVALYNDPIRGGNCKITLCETYSADKKPTATNHRTVCSEAMNAICDHEPFWGFEQEYQLMDVDGRPFGWPIMHGEPEPHGLYYCGVGAKYAYGRELVEAHYRACLYAGIDLEGENGEVTPGQWEYQIGISAGMKGCDDLWMARFLMLRIAEEYGVHISLHPKILPNWNGAGMSGFICASPHIICHQTSVHICLQ